MQDLAEDQGGLNLYGFVHNMPSANQDIWGNSIFVGAGLSFGELIAIGAGIEGVMAMYELMKGYMDMRNANVKGSDKWFHCMSMCRAAEHSLGIATLGAFAREAVDLADWWIKDKTGMTNESNKTFDKQLLDSLDDMAANMIGMDPDSSDPCEKRCCEYWVNGL